MLTPSLWFLLVIDVMDLSSRSIPSGRLRFIRNLSFIPRNLRILGLRSLYFLLAI